MTFSFQWLVALVITLVVYGLVFYLLDYLINQIALFEPFRRVARTILVVFGVLLLIGLLLGQVPMVYHAG